MTHTVPVRPDTLLNAEPSVQVPFRSSLEAGSRLFSPLVSESRFVVAVLGSVVLLFAVTFGLLDLDGPVADAYALLILASAWILLNQHEANQ